MTSEDIPQPVPQPDLETDPDGTPDPEYTIRASIEERQQRWVDDPDEEDDLPNWQKVAKKTAASEATS